jgi:hypothetical protein
VRLNVSNSVFLGAIFGLALISVGLKAAAGPPDDGLGTTPQQVETQLANTLRGQGFSTTINHNKFQNSTVNGQRGDCHLSVRDAHEGAQIVATFARDARAIGPVRYLYRGAVSDTPPSVAAWLDRFGNKVYNRLGLQRRVPVPIALATSPGCGGQNFGLSDFRVD